jgi:ubiquinol-cytochrome c reductase subunit 6
VNTAVSSTLESDHRVRSDWLSLPVIWLLAGRRDGGKLLNQAIELAIITLQHPVHPSISPVTAAKMGFFDYVSDLYSAVSIQPVEAEDARQFEGGPVDTSGNQNSGKDASNGGIGTAEQDRGATTQGGASLSSPAAGTDEESAEEADVNKEDAAKAASRAPEAEKGHTPGESASSDDDEEEAEEEDDEEEEDEPEDPKPALEEGKSTPWDALLYRSVQSRRVSTLRACFVFCGDLWINAPKHCHMERGGNHLLTITQSA